MSNLTSVGVRALFARFMNYQSQRKLWKVFGYPNAITYDNYWAAYKRGGIATRIVKAYPSACWRDGAMVQDEEGVDLDEDSDDYSPFAAAWDKFARQHLVFHYLERLDRMTRVGQYGLLVLGYRDNKRLSEEFSGQAELAYLGVYSERSVTIDQWETDSTSERFGLPTMYSVQVNDNKDPGSRQTVPNPSFKVHWTRVLHVVENADDNEVFGEPALRSSWNYLLDLEKVVGSSAETFWLNARGGLAIEAAAESKFTAEDTEAMKKQAQEYEDDLRRVLAVQGATVKSLSANVASPAPNVETLFSLISGATAIPQRILFGSERGELASSEDANSWEARVDERRKGHCGPMILDKFVAMMIESGNLPQPQGEWWATWPEASAASPEKEADIALKRVQGLATYANSAADQIVSSQEVRPWFGLDPEPEDDLMAEPEDADTLGDDLEDEEDEEEEDETVTPPDPEEEEDEV